MSTVDVDDPMTWPRLVQDVVAEWAKRLRGSTQFSADLDLPIEAEDPFRELLAGHPVRMYHCTRLLDSEVQEVRARGLLPLSEQLLDERIERAYTEGYLSSEERDALHSGHVFATGNQRARADQVCLILSNRILRRRSGCRPLLSTWGGEGIYMSTGAVELRSKLQSIGRPAVVLVDVDLSASHREHPAYSGVHKVFVGRALGLEHCGADVFYRAPVPPQSIVDVWQPGRREYDTYFGGID